MRAEHARHCLFGCLIGLVLAGCVANPPRETTVGPVPVMIAPGTMPESALLDVDIEIFHPGAASEAEMAALGIPPELRKAEVRFLPVHLKNTLERTGQWGTVRVVPPGAGASEVLVRGRVERSDGEVLLARIDAFDASGRLWFSKFYETTIGGNAYQGNAPGVRDAFQDLYNTVANDLALHRNALPPGQVERLGQISELRFAELLAPDAFRGYLGRSAEGFYAVSRLPARDDPMLQRVRRIRSRDKLLVDTINGHYDKFYADMWTPYEQWRRAHAEEAAALRAIEREATSRKLLGAAAIAGGIALQALGDENTRSRTGGLSTAMVLGGAMAVKSGYDKAAEAEIHEDAIRELGISLEAEVRPLVVEVEGETIELTGSAEAQYAHWRRLLRQIHTRETGQTHDL